MVKLCIDQSTQQAQPSTLRIIGIQVSRYDNVSRGISMELHYKDTVSIRHAMSSDAFKAYNLKTKPVFKENIFCTVT